MPIYEYLCEKCHYEFEVEQRITADPIKTCPECKARRVKKLISQTSFVLKGGGWYSDLYASSKKTDKGGDKAGDKDSSSDSKTESGTTKETQKDSSKSKSGDKDSKKSKKKSSKTAA